jgi:ankyrin repeat protein
MTSPCVTVFIEGCETGNISVVRNMCLMGVDVNAQDFCGYTGLMWSVINSRQDVYEFLLQKPEINVNLRSSEGLTALQYAIFQVQY